MLSIHNVLHLRTRFRLYSELEMVKSWTAWEQFFNESNQRQRATNAFDTSIHTIGKQIFEQRIHSVTSVVSIVV